MDLLVAVIFISILFIQPECLIPMGAIKGAGIQSSLIDWSHRLSAPFSIDVNKKYILSGEFGWVNFNLSLNLSSYKAFLFWNVLALTPSLTIKLTLCCIIIQHNYYIEQYYTCIHIYYTLHIISISNYITSIFKNLHIVLCCCNSTTRCHYNSA